MKQGFVASASTGLDVFLIFDRALSLHLDLEISQKDRFVLMHCILDLMSGSWLWEWGSLDLEVHLRNLGVAA